MKSDHNKPAYTKDSVDSAKSPSQVIEEELTNRAREDHLISLLHLENQSGLEYFVKQQSPDYNTLEQYLYCDIIPEVPVRTVIPSNSITKENDYPLC